MSLKCHDTRHPLAEDDLQVPEREQRPFQGTVWLHHTDIPAAAYLQKRASARAAQHAAQGCNDAGTGIV